MFKPDPFSLLHVPPPRTIARTRFLRKYVVSAVFPVLLLAKMTTAAELAALPEELRPDPFGGIVAVDRGAGDSLAGFPTTRNPLSLAGARGGYVSFHLVVKLPEGGEFELAANLEDRSGKLQLDLFREWFHYVESDRKYYPDALIPASLPFRSRIPDPDNRIDKQSAQAFWVDIWIPPDAVPGLYRCRAVLKAGAKLRDLMIELRVAAATIPDVDVVTVDHNSYGSSWLADQYRDIKVPSEESLKLIHLYHRLFYEHRGVFHQLGYGHGGKVIREFAPELAGSGRTKHVENWELYDRHYGPLLDGTAFAGSRRGPRPIPFVYLPINPEWPASFLWWGEPGYEVEFTNVLSQIERHFREKGWTNTRFEMFFNHKKRYKAFPWDGDEVRFPEDDKFFVEYGRLLKKAMPPDSPVKIVFRTDASWSMENQFKSLAGIINFWVCGSTEFSWYPEAAKEVKRRGDIIWIYGGPPSVTRVSTAITEYPLRAWVYGIDGWVHWQTVSAGEDPWFHFDGGNTALVYPGDRFGIKGPVPSVRLKIQRNFVQDITLAHSYSSVRPLEGLKTEITRRFNGTEPDQWWLKRPPMADRPPYEWTNSDFEEATAGSQQLFSRLDSNSWQSVHHFIMQLGSEGK